MKQVSVEGFIEKLDCEVYPITIVKFLLNKRRILSYFSKAADKNFRSSEFKVDPEGCEICRDKAPEGLLCRQHTSIQRVVNANNVAFDLDTNTFFFKNEIFRMIGKRLVIVYCPHPKLITGEITDQKARRVKPLTIEDELLENFPSYEIVREFLSSSLLDQNMRCWFNNEFSIVTLPEDRNWSNWCLVANK